MTKYLDFCDRVRDGEFNDGDESFGDELISVMSHELHVAGFTSTCDQVAERMVISGLTNRGNFDGVLEYVEEVFFILTGNTLGF